jgi:hypothetical protein
MDMIALPTSARSLQTIPKEIRLWNLPRCTSGAKPDILLVDCGQCHPSHIQVDSGSREEDKYLLYTGYPIEAYCNEPVWTSDRSHIAYTLAKKPRYFEHHEYFFSDHVFWNIKEEID